MDINDVGARIEVVVPDRLEQRKAPLRAEQGESGQQGSDRRGRLGDGEVILTHDEIHAAFQGAKASAATDAAAEIARPDADAPSTGWQRLFH